MDVARVGLAHGTLEEALVKYHAIRKVAAEADKPIGIMVDLPGRRSEPGTMPEEGLPIEQGEQLLLRPSHDEPSVKGAITVDHEGLLNDLHAGDRVTFGDGAAMAQVIDRQTDALLIRRDARRRAAGSARCAHPVRPPRLSSPTREDLRLLDAFVEVGVDMVAVSFVRSAHDVRRVGVEPHPRGPWWWRRSRPGPPSTTWTGSSRRPERSWSPAATSAPRCPIEELPHLQKRILERCITLGRPAITATQMLESMITQPVADARRGVRHRQRRLRRLQRGHALGRERHRATTRSTPSPRWPASPPAPTTSSTTTTGARRCTPSRRAWRRAIDDTVTNSMTNAAWRAALRVRRHRPSSASPAPASRLADRPVPAAGQDPRVQPGRPGHPPARPQLGRLAVPPGG